MTKYLPDFVRPLSLITSSGDVSPARATPPRAKPSTTSSPTAHHRCVRRMLSTPFQGDVERERRTCATARCFLHRQTLDDERPLLDEQAERTGRPAVSGTGRPAV